VLGHCTLTQCVQAHAGVWQQKNLLSPRGCGKTSAGVLTDRGGRRVPGRALRAPEGGTAALPEGTAAFVGCHRHTAMNALLVYPTFPRSYWGQEYTHPLTGKRAVVPPLGLLTAAALLPPHWRLQLVDTNVERLDDEALAWADVVMLSAMRVQSASFHELVARAHAAGKSVVAGGPYVTSDPDACTDVDHLVIGEAEEVLPQLARELEEHRAPARVQAPRRPEVAGSPVPRFDLLRPDYYDAIGVQFSRGCPYTCEFCDIIELFGRVPRTKTPERVTQELDAVLATGFRGAVFLVDDNFIGNKRAAKRLLARLAEWSRAHRFPFDFFTEASINLAEDDALIEGLLDAGFTSVFIGVETASAQALAETGKSQNLRLDLQQAVEKLVRSGLDVMAGFIVGFDADDESIFERQHAFIAASPITMAMVGILTALPGTQLWQRLAREGRLYGDCVGDTAYRPNFRTALPEEALVRGYARLLERLYEPRAYFERALRDLELQRAARRSPYRRPLSWGLKILARSLWRQGIRSTYRREYWRFLLKAVARTPQQFARAVALAVVGEHMIRYTFEDVLPRFGVVRPPAQTKGRRSAA
jgi:radical SAM superfamily enzyme YgiQ (UPF0313 family)